MFYRPPRPVMKDLPKFAPRGVPGLFVGWHVEPGCGFRGDYYVIPLSSFKTADKDSYHAHRVKELVSFDATKFPLQQAALDDWTTLNFKVRDGADLVPDELTDDIDEDLEQLTSVDGITGA